MSNYLATMAVIKVNYDSRGHDVLQMLVPLVADRVREYSTPLSDEQLQSDLQAHFGLSVPRTVIKTLLRRLAQAGAVVREHGVYMPVREAINRTEFDLAEDLNSVRRSQEELLRDGVAFAKRVFDLDITTSALSDSLAAIVRAQVVPLAIWAVRGASFDIEPQVADPGSQVAAQFVLHVMEAGSDVDRTALEQIAKGGLLAGVLWNADLDAPDRRIDALGLYLDTTLLLRRLGLCGPVRQSYSEELTTMATAVGINLFCFEHNRSEIVGVLSAAAGVLGSGRSDYYGEAVEFMVREGWTPSDVEEVIATLHDRLAELGIEVQRKPPREARYNMDETQLRDLLQEQVRYTNRAALDADVDSFASIFILRRARHTEHFEKSRALFVTTNNNLAIASRRLYKIGEDQLRGVPLALVESQVASYLWARGATDTTGLPVSLLAMGALSVVESNPKTWFKYVTKLDELRARERLDEREYVLLRQSLVARSVILAVTHNDADAFTEDTADMVLKHSLAEYARELQLERDEAVVRLGEQEMQASQAKAEAEAASRARDEDRAEYESGFHTAGERAAKRFVIAVGAILAALTIAGFVVSFPWPLDPPMAAVLPSWMSIALGVIGVLIAAGSLLVGFTVRGFAARMKAPLAAWFSRRYRRRFSRS